MRRALLMGLLLLPGACASLQSAMAPPSLGQRYVVFFPPGGFTMGDDAIPVVRSASTYAVANPAMPVIVAGFADPNGSSVGSAEISQLRAQNVVKTLIIGGVEAGRITRRSFGSVPYTFDSQEGRRVEITIGTLGR